MFFYFLAILCAYAFVHPGVFVNSAQIELIKEAIQAKRSPVFEFYTKAIEGPYGQLNYKVQGPPESGTIECGSYSHPDYGCSAENSDGVTCFLQALLYHVTGTEQYAKNAIAILNSYGHKLKQYNNSNAPLQAAWGTSKWGRCAELILHSNAGWAPSDVSAFANMLRTVPQPLIQHGAPDNGNWELAMVEGMIGIAVFNNDTNLFDAAIKMWQERVPAYFWTVADGPKPVPPPRGNPSWYNMTTFNSTSDGVSQETCRDFAHLQYGVASSFNAAETALIQGVDLYGMEGGPGKALFSHRLAAALEFHAMYLRQNGNPPAPYWLCEGKPTLYNSPTMEVGYTALVHRLGLSLPWTLQHLQNDLRPNSSGVDGFMMIYEAVTHGGGCAGCKN